MRDKGAMRKLRGKGKSNVGSEGRSSEASPKGRRRGGGAMEERRRAKGYEER